MREPVYRPNVGLALFNREGLVFLGRRVGLIEAGWQMPQGGIDDGEAPQEAALRELEEEIGVAAGLVEVLEETPDWIAYDFPAFVLKELGKKNKYVGQKQKWFALRFLGRDSDIDLDRATPEFDSWRWERLERTPALIIPFKRRAYEEVVRRFAKHANPAGSE